jgi:DNA-directed RNA polymerase specialized sigma24 family protein
MGTMNVEALRPCPECPRYMTCVKPCRPVERYVGSMQRGKLRRNPRPVRQEEIRILLDHVRLLPPRHRGVVHLYYHCGLSEAEIGIILGMHRTSVMRAIESGWRTVGAALAARRKGGVAHA